MELKEAIAILKKMAKSAAEPERQAIKTVLHEMSRATVTIRSNAPQELAVEYPRWILVITSELDRHPPLVPDTEEIEAEDGLGES